MNNFDERRKYLLKNILLSTKIEYVNLEIFHLLEMILSKEEILFIFNHLYHRYQNNKVKFLSTINNNSYIFSMDDDENIEIRLSAKMEIDECYKSYKDANKKKILVPNFKYYY